MLSVAMATIIKTPKNKYIQKPTCGYKVREFASEKKVYLQLAHFSFVS